MVVAKKVGCKVAKILARMRPIYCMARACAISHKRDDLPDSLEAIAILQAASPRPPHCELPATRGWPSVPEVEVSIIVPCYNASKYITGCIESILTQKGDHAFEVIAVDDGSTDDTGALLDSVAAQDERLRVVHQANRGFSGARNIGISLARGGLFLFVDSDDELEPEALDVLMAAYAEGKCDFVTASYSEMSEDGTMVKPLPVVRTHGAPWGRVYSREIWRKLEFPEGFWFEDTVQGYCISPTYREKYVGKALYRYRINRSGISSKCMETKKGLDTFWVVDEMIVWCRELGIEFNQGLFDRTLRQLGPLMRDRTLALDSRERAALFVASCELVSSIPEFADMEAGMGGRWNDLLLSLRLRNYQLWRLAVSAL